MPPARKSPTTRSGPRRTTGVRARAASTSAATRREVEQSIARFEKRLDDANDALQTLGKHLGRGAQSGYKEVTATLRALRRDAAKTNKAALKDFDKLRSALTPASVAGRATRTAKASSATSRGATRSTGSRSTSGRSTASRSTAARSTGSRSTGGRSSGTRSAGTRSASSRPASSRPASSRSKKTGS
jgi:hypothetical protein